MQDREIVLNKKRGFKNFLLPERPDREKTMNQIRDFTICRLVENRRDPPPRLIGIISRRP